MITNSNIPGEKEEAGVSKSDPILDNEAQKDDVIKPEENKTDTNDPQIETVVPDNDN